jgi:hypothetical protein
MYHLMDIKYSLPLFPDTFNILSKQFIFAYKTPNYIKIKTIEIARWVPLLEQESSFPGYNWDSCYSIFFLCSVLKIIVCLFVHFRLTRALSDLLQFTAYYYPYGIIKLVFLSRYEILSIFVQS